MSIQLLPLLAALCVPAPQLSFTSQRTSARPAVPPISAPLFSESNAPALPFAPALFGRGIAASDIDRDGRMDFVIATAGGAVIYRNAGRQGFLDETAMRLPASLATHFGGASRPLVGDVNADGWPDLILLADSTASTDVLLLGQSPGVFLAPRALPIRETVASGAVLMDADGDGDLDLVRSIGASGHINAGGRNGLALNDGAGNFTESAAFLQAPWNSGLIPTTGVLAFDANGDGHPDLFFTRADTGSATGSPGAKNQLLFGAGGGAFIDVSASLPNLIDNSYRAVALDLEGDGDLDLVVANALLGVNGANSGDVLVNQGGAQGGAVGTFLDRFGALDEHPMNSEALRLDVLAGDVDLDGRADVLFQVHDLPPGGHQPLFLGAGTSQGAGFVRDISFESGSFIAAGGAFADVDGDGDLDLLLAAAGSAGGGSSLGNLRLFVNRTR